MAFVYHIHLPEHRGDFSRGYVGFTSTTVDSRWKEHKALAVSENTKNYPVYNALRKYGERLVVSTLVEGSNQYCLDVEFRLRPKPNMGWNIACGGGAPMLGMKHSAETIAKMKAEATPERRKKQSERMKLIPTWLHGSSDTSVWAIADRVHACYLAHDSIGSNLLGKAFGLGSQKLESMLDKFREGWQPLDDAEWCEWSKDTAKLSGGWCSGDPLVERKKPEMTEALRKSRAIGGATRVWTDEAKENLRIINLGRKHKPETLKKLSEALTGIRRTDEQKAAIKKRLEYMPWTNATAIHDNWAMAVGMYTKLSKGLTQADLLRELGLPRKSGALAKIVRKLKSGWIPEDDCLYQTWLSEYNQNKETVNVP